MKRIERRKRRGAVVVLMAIALIIFIAMAAFMIDIGRLFVLQSQIQSSVDAGALAASFQLDLDPRDPDKAAAKALEFVQVNDVGVQGLVPEELIIVETGQWDFETELFLVTGDRPNAVRVRARQDNERFTFGRVLGITYFGAPASSIAASGGVPMDIMMVLDLSGSMKHRGRIEALRNSAPSFVDLIFDRIGYDQIGVMGLSAEPSKYDPIEAGHTGMPYTPLGLNPSDNHHVGVVESDLTDNANYLTNSVLAHGNLVPAKYGGRGYTGTGGALRDAAHYLSVNAREDADRIVVLMSDGHANRPSGNGPGYARSMASYAKSLDVTVYTISLGNSADLKLMDDIAKQTNGTHFDATGTGEAELTEALLDAFRGIANALRASRLVE